jgi:hypothetical protein
MHSEGAVELFASGSVRVSVAVKEYGVSRSVLYELMGSGRLPYSQLGRVRVIPRLALAKLLAEGLRGVAPHSAAK